MKKYLFLCLMLCFGTANAGFVGYYDVNNWSPSSSGGTIDLSDAPDSIILINSDDGTSASTDFTIDILIGGTIRFDWDYITADEGGALVDPFGWLLNDTFTLLTISNAGSQSDDGIMIYVLAGDTFGFSARGDSKNGAGKTTISNFDFAASTDTSVSTVPIPAAAWLFGSALLGFFGFARRKANV